MFQGYGRSSTADCTLHPFYNENGYKISEVCLTTILGFSCNKFNNYN